MGETIRTEDFWNREHVVEKFWNGLKDGVIYAKKCAECGAIEFPPHLACNSCGYHETEWTTLSGKAELKSFLFTGIVNGKNMAPMQAARSAFGRFHDRTRESWPLFLRRSREPLRAHPACVRVPAAYQDRIARQSLLPSSDRRRAPRRLTDRL